MNDYEVDTWQIMRNPQVQTRVVRAHSAADALTVVELSLKASGPCDEQVCAIRCIEATPWKPPTQPFELLRGDVIEFRCDLGKLRRGTIEHVQGGECPYVVGYEPEESEEVEDEQSNWNTYGMRLDEFVRLVSRPEPEEP